MMSCLEGKDTEIYSKCHGMSLRILSKGMTKSHLTLSATTLVTEQRVDCSGNRGTS